jgi:hypothetical protein
MCVYVCTYVYVCMYVRRALYICMYIKVCTYVYTTRYGLEGPGIESLGGEIFRTYPDRLRGQPSLLYKGYRVFPGVKAEGA